MNLMTVMECKNMRANTLTFERKTSGRVTIYAAATVTLCLVWHRLGQASPSGLITPDRWVSGRTALSLGEALQCYFIDTAKMGVSPLRARCLAWRLRDSLYVGAHWRRAQACLLKVTCERNAKNEHFRR